VRSDPPRWRDVHALSTELETGATKLNALFRHDYHLTPAAFLARARVERAMELLARERSGVLEAGEASGFESASTFHENFAALTGLTPGAYRDLGPPGFTVRLWRNRAARASCAPSSAATRAAAPSASARTACRRRSSSTESRSSSTSRSARARST
jgi:AraC-like DNA-binding protein